MARLLVICAGGRGIIYLALQDIVFKSGDCVLNSPILDNKHPAAPTVFEPAALLREARRQKGLPAAQVPPICILDPDGDIVRSLKVSGTAKLVKHWPCYHTELYSFPLAGTTAGIIGCAVGAPFAVLVAEELFACGCRLLLSVTSAGQIVPAGAPPYFVVIDRALRDEGTSYHYAAPAVFAEADARLIAKALRILAGEGIPAHVGASWTTDAPFRETEQAIAAARSKGVLAVEMEAAALYTFAQRRNNAVLCLAHVTNTMGLADQDFEKGAAQGADDALILLEALARGLADDFLADDFLADDVQSMSQP
jgi:uridine phosphorylase